MAVYIQMNKNGFPYNVNAFTAMNGFEQMGFEVCPFHSVDDLKEVSLDNIIVGGVGTVKQFLEQKNIFVSDIDYPEELQEFYQRKIWTCNVSQLLADKTIHTPIFVKPVCGKLFNGFVYKDDRDLVGRISPGQDVEVYCSETLTIKTEWRCFVRYGEILDIRKYKGELGTVYDLAVVKKIVQSYQSAPKAYALDIGVTDRGETVIVEMNDAYSLGCYGLDPLLYAKLLSARWAELTDRADECDF